MDNWRARPRFKLHLDKPSDLVIQLLKKAIQRNGEIVKGQVVADHVIIRVPANKQHFWSPQLHIEVENSMSGSTIRGLFGPKPSVWTMFVFFYSTIGFLVLMGAMWGLSQWMLNMNAYALWSIPVGGAFLLIIYMSARIGQRLGKEQMDTLRDFLEDALLVNDERSK